MMHQNRPLIQPGKSADTTGTTVISDTTNRSGHARDVCYGASTAYLARVRCRGIFFEPPGLLREGPYRRRMVGRTREARNRSRDFSRDGRAFLAARAWH